MGKLLFTGCFSLAIGSRLAWQKLSLFYGLVAFAAAIAIALATRSITGRSEEAATDHKSGGGKAQATGGVRDWRSYRTLLSVVFTDTMVQAGVLVFVVFLMLSKDLPLATGATVILLTGGVLGKAGCGFLADRLGVRPAFALIQALTAAGLVAIVVSPDWLALALLVLLGAVAQGSTSITYRFAADLIDPRRMARGYALLYSLTTFSSAVGPLAFGLIADGFGIENAIFAMAARRAPVERWAERFARVYTPAVMVLAVLVALVPPLAVGGAWGQWFYNALVLLVIACPCTLVISTPVSIMAGLAASARQSVLIKGGAYLEMPSRLRLAN